MNLFQRANLSATFLVIGCVITGLTYNAGGRDFLVIQTIKSHPDVALLAFFLIMFKLKTCLDDHKHFGEPYQDKLYTRYYGFVLAIFSWIFWALSGLAVAMPLRSSELLGISLIVSSSWIAVHLIEITKDKSRRSSEVLTSLMREKWFVINMLYLACIAVFLGWISPVFKEGDWVILLVINIFLIYDVITSRSYINVLES